MKASDTGPSGVAAVVLALPVRVAALATSSHPHPGPCWPVWPARPGTPSPWPAGAGSRLPSPRGSAPSSRLGGWRRARLLVAGTGSGRGRGRLVGQHAPSRCRRDAGGTGRRRGRARLVGRPGCGAGRVASAQLLLRRCRQRLEASRATCSAPASRSPSARRWPSRPCSSGQPSETAPRSDPPPDLTLATGRPGAIGPATPRPRQRLWLAHGNGRGWRTGDPRQRSGGPTATPVAGTRQRLWQAHGSRHWLRPPRDRLWSVMCRPWSAGRQSRGGPASIRRRSSATPSGPGCRLHQLSTHHVPPACAQSPGVPSSWTN